jgi:hypothetical protein
VGAAAKLSPNGSEGSTTVLGACLRDFCSSPDSDRICEGSDVAKVRDIVSDTRIARQCLRDISRTSLLHYIARSSDSVRTLE